MLIDWFIVYTLKSKLGDYIFLQNVLLISGMDYTFPTPMMSGLVMYVALAMKWQKQRSEHTLIYHQPLFFLPSFIHSLPFLTPEVRSRCHGFHEGSEWTTLWIVMDKGVWDHPWECNLLIVCIWKYALSSLRKSSNHTFSLPLNKLISMRRVLSQSLGVCSKLNDLGIGRN